MNLLMEDLARNLGPFGEVGGSNSEIGLKEKLTNNEDLEKELWKELRKSN